MTGELRKILSEKAKELTRKIDVIVMKETNLPRVSFDNKILGNLNFLSKNVLLIYR